MTTIVTAFDMDDDEVCNPTSTFFGNTAAKVVRVCLKFLAAQAYYFEELLKLLWHSYV